MGLPDLYLIRHGETVWNAEGRLQGRLDSPLTPRGTAQVMAMRPLVQEIEAARLSSPRGRAVQTATLLFGENFVCDKRLAEIDVGDFTGHLLSDLRLAHPAVFSGAGHEWYDRIPGGERLADVEARLSGFLADLTQPAIIVTHGLVLAMLCSLATGDPLARVHLTCQDQGTLHVIRNGGHQVQRAQLAPFQGHPPTLEGDPAGG